VMNISILGVVPWQELQTAAEDNSRLFVISTMMERLYGHTAAAIATLLIMFTAFASVFSLLLGYSRVPFAAARDGNYFKALARVHPRLQIPDVSLFALAAVAALACFLRLGELIAALVVIRISMQFLLQAIGVMVLRKIKPAAVRPFSMPLYPIPALLALLGFIYVLLSRKGFERQLEYAAIIALLGCATYLVRSYRTRSWPFGPDRS